MFTYLLIYSCYEQRSDSDSGALVEATDRIEIDENEEAGERANPSNTDGPTLAFL